MSKIIVLYTEASEDPSAPISAGGSQRGTIRLSILGADTPELAAIRSKNNVKLEAPSFKVNLVRPVDVGAAEQGRPPSASWGIGAIGAVNSKFNGEGITVAVLDTGIDRRHSAFSGIKIMERDFTGEGNGDENGHGTHCAGTICGRDVDGTRIGVARGVGNLLIAKVLGANGGGGTDSIIDAMHWALENGAHVISMSLGMDFPGFQKALAAGGRPEEVATSMALEGYRENVRMFDAVAKMIEAGEFLRRRAVIVAATGNESRREIASGFKIAKAPPAAATGFIAIGAVRQTNNPDQPYKIADFSNTKADLAAPGVDIWSARVGGGLRSLSGTSMATPHVAGVAALWAQKSRVENDGEVVIGDVVDNLRSQAKLTPGLQRDDVGKGVVQAPQ